VVEGEVSLRDSVSESYVRSNDVISVPIFLDFSKTAILHVLLSSEKWFTIREIVNIAGLSRKTVERHLEALKYLGLIYEERGKFCAFRPVKLLTFFNIGYHLCKSAILVECVRLDVLNSSYFLRIMSLDVFQNGKEFRYVPW